MHNMYAACGLQYLGITNVRARFHVAVNGLFRPLILLQALVGGDHLIQRTVGGRVWADRMVGHMCEGIVGKGKRSYD